ncbi:MAG: sulfotransferase [Candidatus Omnitrophota bacterium]
MNSNNHKTDDILERMVFVGGPPRSGTTFAARGLNLHPGIMTAIDDHVYESWALYYYRDRVGLVNDLRTNTHSPLDTEEVRNALKNRLFDEDRYLIGAAPSSKTQGSSEISKIELLYTGSIQSERDTRLTRQAFPLADFSEEWKLCLKSPEVSFVMPQLATHFPGSMFVMVYRPLIESAESMYRIGNKVKQFPVFHERWKRETYDDGTPILPPGVPGSWYKLWEQATDFQRCVMYAASYLRGILDGVDALSPDRYFIYNHAELRNRPEEIFQGMADFLDVDASGFNASIRDLETGHPGIASHLMAEFEAIEQALDLDVLFKKIESVTSI